jgi:hypothetical protein|nr:MAG TPA: hypothetical protein [Caudoviricetes sp.]
MIQALVRYYARLVQKKQYVLDRDVPEEYRDEVKKYMPNLEPIRDKEYREAIGLK